jgi:hypothetical protein
MKRFNTIIILFLLLLLLPKGLIAQDSMIEKKTGQGNVIGSVDEYRKLNTSLPGEKVYLHLDRPNYMQGDTIWFKAYSWFGFDQISDTVSKVLYVDLLNPEGKAELKRKLLIQNGTSVGEFSLDKNILPGKYNIRAYTRWMQNENTGEPFYQAVTINALNQNFQVDCSPLIIKKADGDSLKVAFRFYEMDPAGDLKSNFSHNVNYSIKIGDRQLSSGQKLAANTKEQIFTNRLPAIGENDSVVILKISIKDERLTFEKEFRIPLKEELDLQFFPEGGKLVNGLESRVAFKAIGTDGLSREVKGIIKSADNAEAASFKSLHKGMGAFLFMPEANKQYTAFVEYNHRQFKFPLPVAVEEGCVMSVNYKEKENAPKVSIRYSPSKSNAQKYVVGSSYGKIRFISKIKTTEDSCRVNIPVELFPEGVARLTLLDGAFKPEYERLIYVERNQRFKIEITPDSTSYVTRSKVTLHIKTTRRDSLALPANLSLAVVDKEQIIKENGGISAYKLLESELKGNIEDPGYYFRNDSLINYKALDLLLLTQGYRRFVNGSIKSSVIKYYPERGFEVTGRVALSGNANKKFYFSDLGVSILCPSENAYFDQTHPDSLGKFTFFTPPMYGKPLSLIKAFTSTGKLSREKIPKEKSFRGDILLDETASAPTFTPPSLSSINIAAPVTEYVRQLQSVMKKEVSKVANGIALHFNLPEFTVTGRDKDWYTRFKDEAKKIVDMDSLDPTGKKYGNVYDLLVREFGARVYRLPGINTIHLPAGGDKDWYFPIYLLNGSVFFNGGEDEAPEMIGRQQDPDSGYGGNPAGELGEKPDELHSARYISLLKDLSYLQINEIKTIMVLPSGNISYHYADPIILIYPHHILQSMVVLETYTKPNFYRGNPDGIKTFILEGLDTPRIFYSPKYEGEALKNPIYDGRATLYWNPAVRTNEKGEAKVEFYTGDGLTHMKVIVNGMEIGNGFTGQGEKVINMNYKR